MLPQTPVPFLFGQTTVHAVGGHHFCRVALPRVQFPHCDRALRESLTCKLLVQRISHLNKIFPRNNPDTH